MSGELWQTRVDLAAVRDRAVNYYLFLDARGGMRWDHAVWLIPGSPAFIYTIIYCQLRTYPVKWFSQLDPAVGLPPGYRWGMRVMHWESILAGDPLPLPQHVPLHDPLPIAHWMAQVLRDGGTPHLRTTASSAVRLCLAALDAGIDLHGGQFSIGGEPVTEARMAVVRRSGANAVPGYASNDTEMIGRGCLEPEASDDTHLFHDRLALIQPGSDGEVQGLPANALLFSSILPTARFILLNVSPGDQAVVVQRACGCPMESLGWTTHLHTIRSYEKLKAGGMNFLDSDITRVLEEVLPARFGGAPTQYQLVEEENEDGNRLKLHVHPTVGPLDTNEVAETFLRAISTDYGTERVMGRLGQDAKLFRVERRAPLAGSTGKILHIHLERRPQT